MTTMMATGGLVMIAVSIILALILSSDPNKASGLVKAENSTQPRRSLRMIRSGLFIAGVVLYAAALFGAVLGIVN